MPSTGTRTSAELGFTTEQCLMGTFLMPAVDSFLNEAIRAHDVHDITCSGYATRIYQAKDIGYVLRSPEAARAIISFIASEYRSSEKRRAATSDEEIHKYILDLFVQSRLDALMQLDKRYADSEGEGFSSVAMTFDINEPRPPGAMITVGEEIVPPMTARITLLAGPPREKRSCRSTISSRRRDRGVPPPLSVSDCAERRRGWRVTVDRSQSAVSWVDQAPDPACQAPSMMAQHRTAVEEDIARALQSVTEDIADQYLGRGSRAGQTLSECNQAIEDTRNLEEALMRAMPEAAKEAALRLVLAHRSKDTKHPKLTEAEIWAGLAARKVVVEETTVWASESGVDMDISLKIGSANLSDTVPHDPGETTPVSAVVDLLALSEDGKVWNIDVCDVEVE